MYGNTTWTNHIRVELNRKKNEEESDLTTELIEQLLELLYIIYAKKSLEKGNIFPWSNHLKWQENLQP